MAKIADEIIQNYAYFSSSIPETVKENVGVFSGNAKLIESYARAAAINALKHDVVEHNMSAGAAQFFYEAHNDVLLSHVHASYGSWRSALQSLRSFLENTMAAVYYADHPIELEKWSVGEHSMAPRELREYIADHPNFRGLSRDLQLKRALDEEYATLSKAVHGANSLFRMTGPDAKTNIATASIASLGKWAARERSSVNLGALMTVGHFKDRLDGAKLQNLRAALAIALSPASKIALRANLAVSIPS